MQRLAPYVLLLYALGSAACASLDLDFDFSDPPPPMLERRDVESADQDAI